MDAFSGRHCCVQFHHVRSPKVDRHPTLQWHPAMALPQSWPSPSPPTITHYNGGHHVTTTTPPKVGRHPPPPHHSTLHWHHVPSNGTTSTPPNLVVNPPPTLQWQCAMAPNNGTTSTAPCNGTLHVQSAKVVRRPPPLLEVRTPIANAIWGKTGAEPKKNNNNFANVHRDMSFRKECLFSSCKKSRNLKVVRD